MVSRCTAMRLALIKMKYNSTRRRRFYYPIKNVTGKEAVEMKSAANGQFNVKGLDAGTYYLKEITPPDDYSACQRNPSHHQCNHSEMIKLIFRRIQPDE